RRAIWSSSCPAGATRTLTPWPSIWAWSCNDEDPADRRRSGGRLAEPDPGAEHRGARPSGAGADGADHPARPGGDGNAGPAPGDGVCRLRRTVAQPGLLRDGATGPDRRPGRRLYRTSGLAELAG